MMRNNSAYLKRLGARILGEANDLKRTPGALAQELGFPLDTVELVINGQADKETALSILKRMTEVYAVSLSSLWVETDDTTAGARIMRSEESKASSRVFERQDSRGSSSPYYEYRDTAMSRTAPFKPEWIKELRFVDDDDPTNPDVAYNNGHLMHQQTFFVGEVNFYWKIRGQSHCAELNTGDSNYITPFVPHSFTSRNRSAPGVIVAVTFSGQIREALDVLSQVDCDVIESYSGDLRDLQVMRGARLKRHLAAESLSAGAFEKYLINLGVDSGRARALLHGTAGPIQDELIAMSEFLNVRPIDLVVTKMSPEEEVAVKFGAKNGSRFFPDDNDPAYRLKPLARVCQQPQLKGFDLSVLPLLGKEAPSMRHTLHEYVYNYGNVSVRVSWGDGPSDELAPGDSVYFRPLTEHAFSVEGDKEGSLVVVRVPGQLSDSAIDEFASFEASGRKRALGEYRQWF